jgi:hypothetical protein
MFVLVRNINNKTNNLKRFRMDKKSTNANIHNEPLSNDNTTTLNRPKISGPKNAKKLASTANEAVVLPNTHTPIFAQSNNRICVRKGNLGKTNRKVMGKETLGALGLNGAGSPGDAPLLTAFYSNGNDKQKAIVIRPLDSNSISTNAIKQDYPISKGIDHSEVYMQSPRCIQDILFFGKAKNATKCNIDKTPVEKSYYSLQHKCNNRYEQNTEWGRRTFELVQAEPKSHHYVSEKVRINYFRIDICILHL